MAETDDSTVAHPRRATGSEHPEPDPRARADLERIHTEADVPTLLEELKNPVAARLVDEEALAAGGMGTVSTATDRLLGRRLAKKSIQPILRDDARMLRMFLREARTTGQLDHPNIVPVYDLGDRDGELYFTMKLVQGRTLKDIIRALPPLTDPKPLDPMELFNLLDVIVKVCDALAFAHSRGIVHCDVKSANVMVGDYGQVYLMDWGIARPLDGGRVSQVELPRLEPSDAAPPEHAEAGTTDATGDAVLGTAAYMSPEQAQGKRFLLDARADVFSAGAILYEILTRQPPYRAETREETLELAREAKFARPSDLAGDAVPRELERIVMKAMARYRSDRYEDTDELKEDLTRFMRGGAEFPQTTFPKGTYIVREGEPGNAAYIIVSGKCEVLKVVGGSATVMTTLGAGEVFGEMAVLSEGPRTATVLAVEDTTVLVVTRSELTRELGTLKPWMARLIQALAERMRDVYTQRRVTLSGGPTAPRVANQVLMHALAWGAIDASGAISMPWSVVSRELEAQMGAPPHTIHMVTAMYPFITLDTEKDTLVVRDIAGLTAKLRAQLR